MGDKLSKDTKKSLKYVTLEGTAYAVMLGIGEQFLLAYAILMNAGDFEIGILATFPILLASIFQLFSVKILHHMKSRKKLCVSFSLIQAIMWIPIVLVYFAIGSRIPLLVLLVALYWIFGLIVNPIFVSWVGDLVPEKTRGRYFSRRRIATSSATFISIMVGGLILKYAKDSLGKEFLGFAIIFGIALVARLLSVWFYSKVEEVPFKAEKKNEFTLKDFLIHFNQRFKKGYFNTLVLYVALMNFGVYFVAPYIVAHILKELSFSYLQYVIVIGTYIMFQVLFFPVWGRLCDKYSALSVLKVTGYLVALSPILWLIPNNIYQAVMVQMYSGFAMSGFLISSFNFILEVTTPKKRPTAITYYNLINGTFIFLGSICGALLISISQHWNLQSIPYIGSIFWNKYMFIFLVGGLWKLIVSTKIVPKLKEINIHRKISSKDILFKAVSTIPAKGLRITAHHVK